MKIVYLDAFPINPQEIDLSIFKQLGSFITYDRTAPDEIFERAKDANIILTNKVKFNAEMLTKLKNLKHIAVTATGFNIVDTLAAKELGISVSNARNYSTNAVAQQTFAMILSFANRLAEHSDNKKWVACPDFCYYDFSITELAEKTIGLIGFGDIGSKVAEIARVFGMKVLVYKPRTFEVQPTGTQSVSLDDLLKNSDYVSLHCPLTSENTEMVNSDFVSKMKPNAVLINTARGGLINEHELAEALDKNLIKGAYLDVLSEEPPQSTNPLLNVKNCKISPHIAWSAMEARQKLIMIVFENVKSFIAGKSINLVN